MTKFLKPPPEWFNIRADEPSPWASVRVPLDAIEWLAQLWAAPATHAAMASTWGSFLSSEAHFRAQLPNVDWTTRGTSWELVKFLHVAAGVDQGITNCTPDLPDLPRGAKARLYYHGNLMRSMGHAYQTGVPTTAAVKWAVMKALGSAACYAMGPMLAREIRRRGAEHSGGFGAALLELLRQAEHLVPLFGVREEEIVDRATRAARGQTASLLKGRGLSYSQITDFLEGLPGQATDTVASELGAVDALELMARALDGGLDHAGRMIALDAADAARPASDWRKFELHFTEVEDSPGKVAPTSGSQRHDEAAQDRLRALMELASADPQLQRYITAAAAGGDRAAIARRMGRSIETVDKLKARLKKLAKTLPT